MKKQFLSIGMAAVMLGASVPVLPVMNMTVSAEQSVSMSIEPDRITAKPGEKVAYSIRLKGNTGFDALYFSLKYDDRLECVLQDGKKDVPENSSNAYDSFDTVTLLVNPAKNLIGYVLCCNQAQTKDDILTTLYFVVPENAKSGDVYEMTFVPEKTQIQLGDTVPKFTVTAGQITVSAAEPVPGDINGDGNVNLKDVTLLRRYIAGGWNIALDESTADLNGDGKVNLKDVTLLRRFIAGGWNVTLEAPKKDDDSNKNKPIEMPIIDI